MTPRSVLRWRDRWSWTRVVRRVMSDVITPDVINVLRADPPEYLVPDDSRWLDDAICSAGIEVDEGAFSILAQRLPSAFRAVTTFHSSRPDDPTVLLREGLTVMDPQVMRERASAVFVGVPADTLERALNEIRLETRTDVIHVVLDRETLEYRAGQYLAHGSEYLQVVAVNLERLTGVDYRARILAYRGVPTMFECEIPMAVALARTSGEELAGNLLEHLLNPIIKGERPQLGIDFTFTLKERVDPKWIVSHTHPARIRSPFA